MKNKIMGICICTLLIATAVPAVISVKNSEINTTTLEYPLINMGMKASVIPKVEYFKNNAINTRISHDLLASMAGGWFEKQKLTYQGAKADYFGCDVAIDGDTALIAAPADDNWNGSVYVYTRTGTTWTQQQKLTPSDPGVDDCFGIRIALQGDTALIGADDEFSQDSPGAAYVFTRTGTTWTEQQKLIPPDGDAFDGFCNVALDTDTAIIGAPYDDDNGVDSGATYVFTRSGDTWTQQAKLFAADPMEGELFGYEVSLDGDTAVMVTYDWWNDTVNPGAAYVFTRMGTTWTQQAKLVGSDTVPGDTFGIDVSLDDDTVIVGAVNDDDQGPYSGTAFVFTRTGTTWTQQAKLLASDGTYWDWFGGSVSLQGDTALIGAADDEDNGAGSGSAYVFTRTGTTWSEQQHLLASDGAAQDNFGWPVYLDGDTAFIGAWYDPAQGPNAGSVYVFTKTSENQPPVADFSWTPQNPGANQQITFDASASHDLDGNLTLYEWDWDNDGVYDESQSSPTTTHTWTSAGTYPVTVQVTDDGNATGSVTKTVKVNDTIIFSINITGGFGIKAVVTNTGTLPATNIQWTFTLTKGFILLGKTKSGTITSLAVGASATIKDIPIIGVGKTIIKVNVTCAEGYNATQSVVGSMFLFFVLGIQES